MVISSIRIGPDTDYQLMSLSPAPPSQTTIPMRAKSPRPLPPPPYIPTQGDESGLDIHILLRNHAHQKVSAQKNPKLGGPSLLLSPGA